MNAKPTIRIFSKVKMLGLGISIKSRDVDVTY
jgi:hypothetical protein